MTLDIVMHAAERDVFLYGHQSSMKALNQRLKFEGIITDSLSYLHKEACIKVYGFVIMPNHVHLVRELIKQNGKESPAASLMKFIAKQFQKRLHESLPQVLEEYKVNWNSRNYNF